MKKKVDITNIYSGMEVFDAEGNKGIIRDCGDLHNVHVTFEGTGLIIDWYDKPFECGGSGLYCFEHDCDENTENSDTLYYVE